MVVREGSYVLLLAHAVGFGLSIDLQGIQSLESKQMQPKVWTGGTDSWLAAVVTAEAGWLLLLL